MSSFFVGEKMSKRIETEKKYYCKNKTKLIILAEFLGFKLLNENKEVDEYFTDINSEYIKNRTCLRIRKTNNDMEITFKGKSKEFESSFVKLESNFEMDLNNYDSFIELFSMIGYYSYTIVDKNRLTYEMKDNDYTYSIMIDDIKGVGGFVEFELLCDNGNYNIDELKNKLDKFVSLFKSLKLKEALLPYRDFVADKIYNDIKPKQNIKGVCLNIDNFLKKYEKDFYKYYKSLLKNNKITDEAIDSIIESDTSIKISDYLDNLKVNDSNFMVMIELLKKINKLGLKTILNTKCNKTFIENVIFKLADNTFEYIIDKNDNKYFNVKGDLKEVNSQLLIILNNYKIKEIKNG